MTALTAKQRELLHFIRRFSEENGQMPSFQEMCEGMELASKSGIHRLITGLEERGFIRRLRDKARAIELVDDPHLPSKADLGSLSAADFAKEAKRRGLVIGSYHRASYRVGSETRSHRYFVEIAA